MTFCGPPEHEYPMTDFPDAILHAMSHAKNDLPTFGGPSSNIYPGRGINPSINQCNVGRGVEIYSDGETVRILATPSIRMNTITLTVGFGGGRVRWTSGMEIGR